MHECCDCGSMCDCDWEDHDQSQPADCVHITGGCPSDGDDDYPWPDDESDAPAEEKPQRADGEG